MAHALGIGRQRQQRGDEAVKVGLLAVHRKHTGRCRPAAPTSALRAALAFAPRQAPSHTQRRRRPGPDERCGANAEAIAKAPRARGASCRADPCRWLRHTRPMHRPLGDVYMSAKRQARKRRRGARNRPFAKGGSGPDGGPHRGTDRGTDGGTDGRPPLDPERPETGTRFAPHQAASNRQLRASHRQSRCLAEARVRPDERARSGLRTRAGGAGETRTSHLLRGTARRCMGTARNGFMHLQ